MCLAVLVVRAATYDRLRALTATPRSTAAIMDGATVLALEALAQVAVIASSVVFAWAGVVFTVVSVAALPVTQAVMDPVCPGICDVVHFLHPDVWLDCEEPTMLG